MGYCPYTPPKEEKPETLSEAIHRLSQRYGVSERLVKLIVKCEAGKYPRAVAGKTQPLVIDGVTYFIDVNSTNRNGTWSTDYGPMMINDYWHEAKMRAEGLSITNWADSLAYGVELLSKQGTGAWNASRSCWSDEI